MTSAPSRLAQLIVEAQRERSLLGDIDPALSPSERSEAYQTQQEVFRLNDFQPGGWKIGAKSPTDQVQGSPLPRSCLFGPGQTFDRANYAPVGLELEVAFRFKQGFATRSQAYTEEEVLASVGEMAATIEIVSSRFASFPKVAPLTQLADLLNHGALIVGEFVPYRSDFNFIQPSLTLTLNGENIVPATVANPAGDPRRLLTWLVNHHTQQGKSFPQDFVITTGSYTGMYFAGSAGEVRGQIDGLPEVSLKLV